MISKTFLRGFEGLPPMWRRSQLRAFKKTYPRDGEPWKPAEDRRLLARYERTCHELAALSHGARYAWWIALAKPFGRTDQAVRARVNGLVAGKRAVSPAR